MMIKHTALRQNSALGLIRKWLTYLTSRSLSPSPRGLAICCNPDLCRVIETHIVHMAEIHNANQIEQDEINPEDGMKYTTRSVQRAFSNFVLQQLFTILMYRRNPMTEPP